MNFEDMPNSAYAAYLQSKKAEEERKSNDQYKNSMTDAAKSVIEQNGLLVHVSYQRTQVVDAKILNIHTVNCNLT